MKKPNILQTSGRSWGTYYVPNMYYVHTCVMYYMYTYVYMCTYMYVHMSCVQIPLQGVYMCMSRGGGWVPTPTPGAGAHRSGPWPDRAGY